MMVFGVYMNIVDLRSNQMINHYNIKKVCLKIVNNEYDQVYIISVIRLFDSFLRCYKVIFLSMSRISLFITTRDRLIYLCSSV